MQLTKTIFHDSATFIVKKKVENRLWRKSAFCGEKVKNAGEKKNIMTEAVVREFSKLNLSAYNTILFKALSVAMQAEGRLVGQCELGPSGSPFPASPFQRESGQGSDVACRLRNGLLGP
jgi:hypothetical protein